MRETKEDERAHIHTRFIIQQAARMLVYTTNRISSYVQYKAPHTGALAYDSKHGEEEVERYNNVSAVVRDFCNFVVVVVVVSGRH